MIRPKKPSAGKGDGTGNGRIGHSYVTWAFSEAVILFVREPREVQPYIRRLERKYGTDKAKGLVAHRLGRTVYDMWKTHQVCDIKKFVNQEPDSPCPRKSPPQTGTAYRAVLSPAVSAGRLVPTAVGVQHDPDARETRLNG